MLAFDHPVENESQKNGVFFVKIVKSFEKITWKTCQTGMEYVSVF